jgi:holo-[acyl-carrier protein] synthase
MEESENGVIARASEVVAIDDVAAYMGDDAARRAVFTDAEQAYARSRRDPERRLAARLAAKLAARQALGEEVSLRDLEVTPARGGPPGLRLSGQAAVRARALGVARVLVSLTHGLTHAAAVVLLLGEARCDVG